MGIYRWVGAGLLDCRLLTIIVCETRPYDRFINGCSEDQFDTWRK